MYGDHDEGLDEQSGVVAGARPVEDLEDGGGEHDEGNVEGEASGGTGAVDGEDLIGIGGDGGEDEAVSNLAVPLVVDMEGRFRYNTGATEEMREVRSAIDGCGGEYGQQIDVSWTLLLLYAKRGGL